MPFYPSPVVIFPSRPPSAEIIELIFSWCSPGDLLQCQVACKDFVSVLSNSPGLWRIAREAFYPPIPPPPGKNVTEAAFASLLFAGGPCDRCGYHTNEISSINPVIRFCSRTCYDMITGPPPIHESDPGNRSSLLPEPVVKMLVYGRFLNCMPSTVLRFHGEPTQFFKRTDVQRLIADLLNAEASHRQSSALRELVESRRAQVSAKTLVYSETLQWIAAYGEVKDHVHIADQNKQFLQILYLETRIAPRALELSPTLARHINAYMRDSVIMNPQTWATIYDAVVSQVTTRSFPGHRDGSAPRRGVCCIACGDKSHRFMDRVDYFIHMKRMHPTLIKEAPPFHRLVTRRHPGIYYSNEAPRRNARMEVVPIPRRPSDDSDLLYGIGVSLVTVAGGMVVAYLL